MRAETAALISDIEKSLELLRQRLGWETAEHRLEEYNAISEDPALWNDPAKAQKLMRERQQLSDALDDARAIAQELDDNQELIELGEMEDDADVVAEAEAALATLKDRAAQKEIEALLNGEAAGNDTFLDINPGAGGTESCDWAALPAAMSPRWAAAPGSKVSTVTSRVSVSKKSTVDPVNSSPGRLMLMFSVTADASLCGRIEVSVDGW